MPMAKHTKFARALVKQFGRTETRNILAVLLREGDASIKKLAQLSHDYLYSERITQEALEKAHTAAVIGITSDCLDKNKDRND